MPLQTLASRPINGQTAPLALEYATFGNPNHPTVLLIMGLGMQRTAWPAPMVQVLVDQSYHVVTFDNRDVGLSTHLNHVRLPNMAWWFLKAQLGLPVTSPYRLSDMADDAIALMDALGIAKAHVVGASMGGMIAQLVACRAPSRVLSLTSIMSSSGRRGLPGPSAAIRRMLLTRPPQGSTAEQIAAHQLRVFRAIGSPQSSEPDTALLARLLEGVKRSYNPAGTLRQLMAIITDGSRVKRLQQLALPSLVIHGELDPLVPPACGLDTARCIANAKWVPVPGMGHDFAPEGTQAMTRAITDFLSSLR